jgi:hypothetical protein
MHYRKSTADGIGESDSRIYCLTAGGTAIRVAQLQQFAGIFVSNQTKGLVRAFIACIRLRHRGTKERILAMTKGPRPLNAWKHGGYSNLGVLPGEDPKEFDDFHRSLIEEWQPSGATECDAVLSLAKCIWRKSRMNIYRQAAAARKTFAGAEPDPLQSFWDACAEATKGYEPPE